MSNKNNEYISETNEEVRPEDVNEESVQPENETESDVETQEGQTESTESTEGESKKDELTAEEQKRLGKAIKAIRERERAEAARQIELERQRLAQMQQQQQPQAQAQLENSIFDPATGEYVSADSAIGQILVRQQKIMHVTAQRQAHQEFEQLSKKAAEGYERFTDYADMHKNFVDNGTDFMADALKGVDDPAVVINYLGKHPEELKRIAQLPPERQRREIYNVDSKLNPPKKLVSKAPAAVGSVNESNNPSARAEHQSYDQRADYYARKYTRR